MLEILIEKYIEGKKKLMCMYSSLAEIVGPDNIGKMPKSMDEENAYSEYFYSAGSLNAIIELLKEMGWLDKAVEEFGKRGIWEEGDYDKEGIIECRYWGEKR